MQKLHWSSFLLGAALSVSACTTADDAVTFHADVRPIIEGRCVGCHQQGGVAPFALETFEQIHAHREAIRSSVMKREMPPWLATDDCNDYLGDVSLTDEQIDTIARWVDQGAEAGDPQDMPGALAPPEDQRLSRVDLTLEMPVAYQPSKTPDDYRCFLLDWPETETKFVTGFGANPGNSTIVHHMIAFLVPPEKASEYVALDAAEEGAGYTCFGGPGGGSDRNVNWLGAWAPGGLGYDQPPGTGIQVEPGSKIVLQMHYNALSSSDEPDRSSIDLKLDATVDRPARVMPFANPAWVNFGSMEIPAGEEDVMHRFELDVTSFQQEPRPFTIYSGSLHMHLLGERSRLWINRKDGTKTCIVNIDRWDFDWQFSYRLKDKLRFEPGDELALECHWDNSEKNQPVIDGQRLTMRDANWGEGSTDEMCLGILYVSQ